MRTEKELRQEIKKLQQDKVNLIFEMEIDSPSVQLRGSATALITTVTRLEALKWCLNITKK